ncbi:MAG: DUF3299 domain-containing protein [Pseudomonadota bacterium]
MKRLVLLMALASLPALADDYKVGDRLAPAPSATPAQAREITWDDLLPKGWDPMKTITDLKLDKLQDADPRAIEAMEKLKAMWNAAPSNPEIAGRTIRIPGFVVPLEYGQKAVKEFLLVPYFGACIHVPPPPANQIIHVLPRQPVQLKTGMDAVWVEGVIELASKKTDMGDSGYRLRATKVEAYKERKVR